MLQTTTTLDRNYELKTGTVRVAVVFVHVFCIANNDMFSFNHYHYKYIQSLLVVQIHQKKIPQVYHQFPYIRQLERHLKQIQVLQINLIMIT